MQANLETIARSYLPAGTLARVEVVDLRSRFLQGVAYRTPDGWHVIELDERFVADGFTFFHELAHLVLGHVKIERRADEPFYTRPSQAKLTEVEREELTRYIDAVEDEANAWAVRELARFQRRFGAFEDALCAPAG